MSSPHVRDTVEQPYIRERAVSIYTMQRAYFEERLFDERHWTRYFQLLARSRINSFVVVFGYEKRRIHGAFVPITSSMSTAFRESNWSALLRINRRAIRPRSAE